VWLNCEQQPQLISRDPGRESRAGERYLGTIAFAHNFGDIFDSSHVLRIGYADIINRN
jgi:hypothetical protein